MKRRADYFSDSSGTEGDYYTYRRDAHYSQDKSNNLDYLHHHSTISPSPSPRWTPPSFYCKLPGRREDPCGKRASTSIAAQSTGIYDGRTTVAPKASNEGPDGQSKKRKIVRRHVWPLPEIMQVSDDYETIPKPAELGGELKADDEDKQPEGQKPCDLLNMGPAAFRKLTHLIRMEIIKASATWTLCDCNDCYEGIDLDCDTYCYMVQGERVHMARWILDSLPEYFKVSLPNGPLISRYAGNWPIYWLIKREMSRMRAHRKSLEMAAAKEGAKGRT